MISMPDSIGSPATAAKSMSTLPSLVTLYSRYVATFQPLSAVISRWSATSESSIEMLNTRAPMPGAGHARSAKNSRTFRCVPVVTGKFHCMSGRADWSRRWLLNNGIGVVVGKLGSNLVMSLAKFTIVVPPPETR
jgi:hypothetical protein